MNVLLTSAGRRSYLVKYFKEAIGDKGLVHVANSSEISTALQIADKAVITPLIYDDNYIPFLLEYCQQNDIAAIISLFDIDLPILSKNKNKFENIGTKVIVSEPKVIDICNDKWNTYNYLVSNGLNVPQTYISIEDAEKAIDSEEISFPLIVKPRWGMGSIAVYEAETKDELRVFYEKTKRNIMQTYLKYESNEDINKSVLIQEKLIGQEYGLDIINDLDGNYINTIVKKKYAMRSGETDCAVTVENMDAKFLGKQLSTLLKHIGNLDVDVFLINEKLYVLEMNARFGGGYPFSHMAGINLPVAIISWLKGESVDNNILSERINIMSQKDISLIRLELKQM